MNCFSFPMAMQTQPGYNLREEDTLEDNLVVEIVVLVLDWLADSKKTIESRINRLG